MTVTPKPSLTVMDHPLVDHKLSILRDRSTPSHAFRQTLHELSWLLAHPTFTALRTEDVEIDTPLERMTARQMRPPYPCVVSILRAGNGLVDGFSQVCPEASVGLSASIATMTRWSRFPITAACQATSPTGR